MSGRLRAGGLSVLVLLVTSAIVGFSQTDWSFLVRQVENHEIRIQNLEARLATPMVATPSATFTPSPTATPTATSTPVVVVPPTPTQEVADDWPYIRFATNALNGNINIRSCPSLTCPVVGYVYNGGYVPICDVPRPESGGYYWRKIADKENQYVAERNTAGTYILLSIPDVMFTSGGVFCD